MRRLSVLVAAVIIFGMMNTFCYAGCDCDDWMKKGGYCVDYIKSIVPLFPIPLNTDEIEELKNKDISDVAEGDVAIFSISNYWHVAYVEAVRRNQQGEATAIDVSEMNFGDQLTFAEFKNKWKSSSEAEWRRALCCGITDTYAQKSTRKNVALDTVKQIWSPVIAASEAAGGRRANSLTGRIRQTLNRFLEFTGREL
ncbi:MAG: hypothetical protein M0023_01700 [Desulfobacteraceae bacterium]|nr:hypothetical protein [Desulfobacteraceae bacterium]